MQALLDGIYTLDLTWIPSNLLISRNLAVPPSRVKAWTYALHPAVQTLELSRRESFGISRSSEATDFINQ